MEPALSDDAWARICEAAKRDPDADARAELERVLFEEYPGFARNRERVDAALRQSERMLKRLDAFATLYWWTWAPDLPPDEFHAILDGRSDAFFPANKKTEADLWCMKILRRRPLATWLACRAFRRDSEGRRNPLRGFLVSRLCSIWLYNFGGRVLTVTIPPLGGEPGGPLIEFLLAAMREVVPPHELPRREALRDAIDRERQEHERARQYSLELKIQNRR
jgi:hypothetical protein